MTKEKFSIRKTNRGAVSARIALVGLLAVAGLATGAEVKADTVASSNLPLAAAGESALEAKAEADQTVVTVESPVTYLPDETKEAGVTEVTQAGQDGSLTTMTENGEKTVVRVEPTTTVVTVGTKPTVEEKVLETAQTEYVANEQLEAGKEVLVQEGTDGKEVTTTTYKVVAEEDLYNPGGSNEQSQDWFKYIGFVKEYDTPYTIDNSQKRDSDKVVIDEEAIKADLAKLTTTDEWKEVLKKSSEELSQSVYLKNRSNLYDTVSIYFERHNLSEAAVAYVKEQRLRFDAALDYLTKTYGQDQLANHLPEYWFHTSETTYTLGLQRQGQRDENFLQPHTIVDNYNPTFTALAKSYLKHLDEQGFDYEVVSPYVLKIDGVDYEIAFKEEVAVIKTLENLTADEIAQKVTTVVNQVQTASETLTKRYNNARGEADKLPIVYESIQMTAEEKAWFEEKVASLPRGIKQNMVKVTIKDSGETLANGGESTGMADPYNNEIKLNYSQMGSKERLLKVFLHELSHVIDFNMARGSGTSEFIGFDPSQYDSLGEVFRINPSSNTIYDTYFNPSIDKESPTVRPYYRDYVVESFAEFFSDYIMTRHFPEYKPVKFIEVDGEVLTLRDMDWGSTAEEIAEDKANYEKYYNDPKAYAPAKAAESFFADLYNKLFEQPTHAKVLIDQVKTETVAVRHKVVEVGTKPTIVREETQYTTLEVKDENLLIGERKVIQTGRNGVKQTTTTYELVDNTTGKVISTTKDEILEELVQEIIAIGTKEKQEETPKPTTPPVSDPQPEAPKPEAPKPTTPPVADPQPEAPKPEAPQPTDTVALSQARHQFLALLDQSGLTDEQKGELAIRATFAESLKELAAVLARFEALTAPVGTPAPAGQTKPAAKPAASTSSAPVAAAAAAPVAAPVSKPAGKTLPATGDKTSTMALLGTGLVLVSLGAVFQRRKS